MPRLFFLIFIFLFVISCIDKSFPLVIGHRGAMGYIAENTIPSIEKAIELGVDGIEIDIFKCASGELVVFQGTVSDGEDAVNTLQTTWTSNVDGELYSGVANSSGISQFPSSTLSAGVHSITMSVVDSDGLIAEDLINFRVNTNCRDNIQSFFVRVHSSSHRKSLVLLTLHCTALLASDKP